MRFVSVSYTYSPDFNTPESWLKRTELYNGLLEYLANDNTVISIKQINYEGGYNYNGVEHHFVIFSREPTYFPGKLNRYVKALNPDVVFVQGLHQPLQLIQLGLMLNKKTRIIAQHHAERPLAGFKKYIQRIASLFVDAYLFASLDMSAEWVENGNIAPSKKIYEVMEVSSLFQPVKKEYAKLRTGVLGGAVFLWVGRLNENKDPLNVVRAFLKFCDTNPHARLYMIYHTDELLNDIKMLLEKVGGASPVILIGQVPHEELLYWFNSADFFVSGSYYEGSGTAVCEAMSCGCVPVVTDIAAFRMITDNGRCGLLYEAGNEAALLAALQKAINMDIREKQKASLEYFKSNLSFEAIGHKIQEVVASL